MRQLPYLKAVPVSAGSAVMVWVMGNIRLLLEWLTVPLFIIALQLPQGAVLYWLVSSLTALAQVLLVEDITSAVCRFVLLSAEDIFSTIRRIPAYPLQ